MDCRNAKGNEKRSRRRKKSFTEALKEKYCGVEDEPTFDFIIISPKRKSNTTAELAHLQTVVLNEMDVTRADIPCHGLTSLCPNVVDLDLANNLLEKWTELLTILSHLPKVKYVNVSRNSLRLNSEDHLPDAKLSVENLALNDTGVSIEEIVKLSHLMPMLKELHLCGNNYEDLGDVDLSIKQGALSTLECLRLNNNGITSWSEVWKLRDLPHLKFLVLSGNPVQDVFYETDSKPTKDDLEQDSSQNASDRWDQSNDFCNGGAAHVQFPDVDEIDQFGGESCLDDVKFRQDIFSAMSRGKSDSESDDSDAVTGRYKSERDGAVSANMEDVNSFLRLCDAGNTNFNNSYCPSTQISGYPETQKCSEDCLQMSKFPESESLRNDHRIEDCLMMGSKHSYGDRKYDSGSGTDSSDENSDKEADMGHKVAAETFLNDVINGLDFTDILNPNTSSMTSSSETSPAEQITQKQTSLAGRHNETKNGDDAHIKQAQLYNSISATHNTKLTNSNYWMDEMPNEDCFTNCRLGDVDACIPRTMMLSDEDACIPRNMMLSDEDACIPRTMMLSAEDARIPRTMMLSDEDIKSFIDSDVTMLAKSTAQRCLFPMLASELTATHSADHPTMCHSLSDTNETGTKADSLSLNVDPGSNSIINSSISSERIVLNPLTPGGHGKSADSLKDHKTTNASCFSCQDDSNKDMDSSQHMHHSCPSCQQQQSYSCHSKPLQNGHIEPIFESKPFDQLQILCLSNAGLSHWSHLEPFTLFPKLTNVRLKNNPLYSCLNGEDKRKMYIASLPTVNVLNGSEVTPMEREKAELHYLRFYMDIDEKPDIYQTLVKKHGQLKLKLVDIDLRAGYHEWANLKFVSDGVVKFTRRVHLVEPVSRLRSLIATKLDVPKSCFVLYHHTCGPSHPEAERELVELRCESLPMSRFGFAEGDEIHIDVKG
ncbi:unnamed protein product [Lymnaea stagnalis]|uniref:Tubulin-specific chaperone cofactor E-like protein n=1 Tax=Lymnaea stagnalis TaxID=6523 RepID=A0AAV2HPW6_LYMST